MKIWNWIKVAIGIVFTVLIYIFLTKGSNTELKKKIDEVKVEAKKEEEKVEKVEKRIEDRKKRAEKLNDKLRKHFHMFIIVCLIVSFSVVGIASQKDLIIPDNYSDLVLAYKDMAEIAVNYQRLYNEAEKDNDILIESIKNLQNLLKVQQDIIDDLLNKNRFNILAGFNYVPLNPSYSGIMAGITFEF